MRTSTSPRTCDALWGMSRLRPVAGRLAPLVLLPTLLLGCASKRPVLYPNPHLEEVGTEVAEIDIDECMSFAETEVGRESAGGKVARDTAVGGGSGAAIGAALGAGWVASKKAGERAVEEEGETS